MASTYFNAVTKVVVTKVCFVRIGRHRFKGLEVIDLSQKGEMLDKKSLKKQEEMKK